MEQAGHLSEKLLARRWGLSHRTLERWRHDGNGPAYLKFGSRVVYRIEDVEAFEAERRRTAGASARNLSSHIGPSTGSERISNCPTRRLT